MITFSRLRIELKNHPGALSAASRVIAAEGLNIVEISIHEVDGSQAVDEIVVHSAEPIDSAVLARSLAGAGAELLSAAPCESRGDPVVTALTWVTASLDRTGHRSSIASGVSMLTGISPVQVVSAGEAERIPVGAAALKRGWPVVQRTDEVPDSLRTPDGTSSPRWVLAAPDAPNAAFVVFASRPYTIRFTATELSRLAAVLDCRRQLMAAQRVAAPV